MLETITSKMTMNKESSEFFYRAWQMRLVLILTFLFSQTADANLSVEQITQNNATELIMKGPDAIGGIGDWFISNGILCAVFSDVSHEGEFSSRGGILVDLGY